MIGLNVGSGQRPFDQSKGWINIDCVEREGMPKPDLIADGAHLPFPDNYADFFVLHHVLEHFGCGEGKGLLHEAYRVLKPGGSLLVFVPNLRSLAKRWLEGGLSTQVYVTNLYGAYMGDEADRHKWGFDSASLMEFLVGASWEWVTAFDWREIPGAHIAKDFWILGAECTKK